MAYGLWLTAYGILSGADVEASIVHSKDSRTVIRKTEKGEVHKRYSAQDNDTVSRF